MQKTDTEATAERPPPGRPWLTPRIVTFVSALLVVGALFFAREVLIPIALSILLAFLLAPIVTFLERRHWGRFPAVLAVVLSVVVALATMGWFVVGQVTDFAAHLPEYKHTLQRKVDDLRVGQSVPLERAAQVVEELGRGMQGSDDAAATDASVPRIEVAPPSAGALATIRGALERVLSILGFAAIVVLLVFFMLLQRVELRDHLIWLAGEQRLHVTTQMLEDASKRVSQFLFAQFLVNVINGVFVAIGLAVIGVPNALLFGFLSCLLRFIPYIGPWIAALGPMAVSLAVFDGWAHFLYTAGWIGTLELLTNNLLEPLFFERRTGASPLAIIVSALFWTWLWGGVGLVLSMPITVCLMVIGDHIPQLRFLSTLLGKKSRLSSSARLYQRLLAGDHDGAEQVVLESLESAPLVDVLDGTMLPALRMAAQDWRPGHVDESKQETIERNLATILDEIAERAVPGETVEAPLRVLCLPASDSADEIACRILGIVLRESGMECDVVSVDRFASEMLEAVERFGPDVVCISHVPPPTLAPVRYLGKRLAERFPALPVIVGIWTSELEEKRIRSRLPKEGEFHVATSLGQARAQARQIFESLRHRPDRSAPVPSVAAPPRAAPRASAPAGA